MHLLIENKKQKGRQSERKQQTVDGWTVRIPWLLQACHGQGSLNPHIWEFVRNTYQHGLVDAIKEVIVYLGILRHTAQQFVDQLAHPETHSMAIGFVRLRGKGKQQMQRETVKMVVRLGRKYSKIQQSQ